MKYKIQKQESSPLISENGLILYTSVNIGHYISQGYNVYANFWYELDIAIFDCPQGKLKPNAWVGYQETRIATCIKKQSWCHTYYEYVDK